MKVFFYMEYYSGSIVLPYLNNFNLHVFYIVTLLIEMDIAVKKKMSGMIELLLSMGFKTLQKVFLKESPGNSSEALLRNAILLCGGIDCTAILVLHPSLY